jgi:hypothetical protein
MTSLHRLPGVSSFYGGQLYNAVANLLEELTRKLRFFERQTITTAATLQAARTTTSNSNVSSSLTGAGGGQEEEGEGAMFLTRNHPMYHHLSLYYALVACWGGFGFRVDHFQVINDVNILRVLRNIYKVIQTLLTSSSSSSSSSSSFLSSSTPAVGSFTGDTRSIFLSNNNNGNRNGGYIRLLEQLKEITWALFQHICVHFATRIENSNEFTSVPALNTNNQSKNLNEIFEVIYEEAQDAYLCLNALTTTTITRDQSSNGNTIQKSFDSKRSIELIHGPKKFSMEGKGLLLPSESFGTQDTSDKNSNVPSVPPVPEATGTTISNTNEWSITTWLFVDSLHTKKQTSGNQRQQQLQQQQHQLVFFHGGSNEILPYLIVVPSNLEKKKKKKKKKSSSSNFETSASISSFSSFHLEVGLLFKEQATDDAAAAAATAAVVRRKANSVVTTITTNIDEEEEEEKELEAMKKN